MHALIAASSTLPWVEWSKLWKIVVLGLVVGAGLPLLFAFAVRALSLAPSGHQEGTIDTRGEDALWHGNVVGLVVAILCIALVLAAVGWGIASLVGT